MDAERLAEAVRQTVDAHCYLKTRLVVAEDDVMQECHDDEEAVVSIETLNEEPDTAFFGQRMRPFNLFNDRLYRIEIYQALSISLQTFTTSSMTDCHRMCSCRV